MLVVATAIVSNGANPLLQIAVHFRSQRGDGSTSERRFQPRASVIAW